MSMYNEETQTNPIEGIAGESVGPIDLGAPKMIDDTSSRVDCDEQDLKPMLSKKRWHILIAVCIIGSSSALQGTGPLLDLMLELIDLKVDTYLYIDLIFNYLTALFAVPAVVMVDRLGLRLATHVAAGLYLVSSLTTSLMYLSELPGWKHYKMFVYILTGVLKSGFFAVFFLLPLKISESWFSATERSLAWMIMFHALSIGNCIAYLLYPRIILKTTDFYVLAHIGIISGTVSMISCIALVTKSEPAVAPSNRATHEDRAPLIVSLKRILKRRDILLHQLHCCLLATVHMTFGAVLQNILSSIGQSQVFAGNFMLVNNLLSVVLSIIMSSFVHKLKGSLQACKIGALFESLGFIVQLVALMNSAPGSVLIGISVLRTIVGSWTMPHYNEMTADLVSGAVSKPTIAGFSLVVTPISVGIIQSTFAKLIDKLEDKNDYHKALVFLIGVCAINEVNYQIFFWGKTSNEVSSGDNQACEQDPREVSEET